MELVIVREHANFALEFMLSVFSFQQFLLPIVVGFMKSDKTGSKHFLEKIVYTLFGVETVTILGSQGLLHQFLHGPYVPVAKVALLFHLLVRYFIIVGNILNKLLCPSEDTTLNSTLSPIKVKRV
jgi:hypothetical protein